MFYLLGGWKGIVKLVTSWSSDTAPVSGGGKRKGAGESAKVLAVSGMQLVQVVRKNRLHCGANARGLLLSNGNEIKGPANSYAAGRSLHLPYLIVI